MSGETADIDHVRRKRRLAELERVIGAEFEEEAHRGEALREVRDERLYRELGPDVRFEDYVRVRLGMTRQHAYKLIDEADIRDALRAVSHACDIELTGVRVAAELAPLLARGPDVTPAARAEGRARVAEAWTKIAAEFGDQPDRIGPTGPEVRKLLVKLGYRANPLRAAGGKKNLAILFGQFGDKLRAAESRLDWFVKTNMGNLTLSRASQEKAGEYAAICERMAETLRTLGRGERPE